jgi:hypothetical protein
MEAVVALGQWLASPDHPSLPTRSHWLTDKLFEMMPDTAHIAVGALIDPHRHNGKAYRPTGPMLLSGQDIANAVGEALGRKVRHIDVPPLHQWPRVPTDVGNFVRAIADSLRSALTPMHDFDSSNVPSNIPARASQFAGESDFWRAENHFTADTEASSDIPGHSHG